MHKNHLFESFLLENKKKREKILEEEKDYEIVKQYANKKPFIEEDWEKFIQNQEYWNRKKRIKAKIEEIIRNNEENTFTPKIDKNSKLMIESMKKRILYIEDIHTRLYNNFDDLEEKRRMKICNSMPSFKPLLNKSFKKATFQKKKFIIEIQAHLIKN